MTPIYHRPPFPTVGATEPALLSREELNKYVDEEHREMEVLEEALDAWDKGEKRIEIVLLGTAESPRLAAAAQFLVNQGLDISLTTVTLKPFRSSRGEQLIARSVDETEVEQGVEDRRPNRRYSIERVMERARGDGVVDVFSDFVRHAQQIGLHVHPWVNCLTINRPEHKSITLIYVGLRGKGRLRWGYSSEAISAEYDLSEEEVSKRLGDNWTTVNVSEGPKLLDAWRRLTAGESQVERDVAAE